MLADVATEIEAARLLVWRAAWMGRNGVPMTAGQGSMSKLKAGDVAMWATTTLMDLVGPFAQTTDCPLEKWFRDAKIYQLFEGTAQVQRLVIARMQTAEYQRRFEEADDVLNQAPGNAPNGSVVAEATRAVAERPSGAAPSRPAGAGRGVRLRACARSLSRLQCWRCPAATRPLTIRSRSRIRSTPTTGA